MLPPECFRDGRASSKSLAFENGEGPLTYKGGSTSLLALLDRTLKVAETVIDMNDTTHTLVVNAAASTNQTRMGGVYYRVDPNSLGASENLVFPAEASLDNLFIFIENTGGEIINVQNDTPATVLSVPAGDTALITCDGTTLRGILLSSVSGYFTSIDLDGTLDQDVALTGTGDGYNNLTTMSHATQTAEAVDVTAQQITNAKTAGELVAYKGSLVGLAGDTAGATYIGLDLNANDTAGSGVFVGIKFGADFDAIMDLTDCLTGEADVIMAANLASAMAWRVATTDFMSLDTSTGVWVLDLDASQSIDYTLVAAGSLLAGNLTCTHASALFNVAAFANVHSTDRDNASVVNILRATIDAAGTDNAGAVYNALNLATDGAGGVSNALYMGAGFTAFADVSSAATGEADFVLGDNLASAMAWRVAANDVLSIDTTTNLWALDLETTLDVDYTSVIAAGFVGSDLNFTLSDVAGGAGGIALVGQAITAQPGVDRAATTGAVVGQRITLVGRAGDHADSRYLGLDFVTNGLGGGLHHGITFDAGWDAILDLSACLTGEADVILADNLASAMAWRVASTDVMSIDTSTGVYALDLDATLDISYALVATGNLVQGALTVSHASDAFDVAYFRNVHNTARTGVARVSAIHGALASDAADDATVLYNAFYATTDGTDGVHSALSVGTGFDRTIDSSTQATGENVWSLPTNVALALRLYDHTATLEYLNCVSTTGAERVNVLQRLTTTDGVASGLVKTVGGLAHAAGDSAAITGNAEALFNNDRTIPAGTLKAGSVIRVTWKVVCTAITTGGDTLTSQLVIGPTAWAAGTDVAIQASTAVVVSANDIFVGKSEIVVKTVGAGGTFDAVNFWSDFAAPGAAVTTGEVDGGAVDTTVENVIGCTAVFSTADTGNTAVCEVLNIEIL